MTATDQNLGKQSFEYDQNDRNLMKSSIKSSFIGFSFRNVIVKWKNVPFLEHRVDLLNSITGYYENDESALLRSLLTKWQNPFQNDRILCFPSSAILLKCSR